MKTLQKVALATARQEVGVGPGPGRRRARMSLLEVHDLRVTLAELEETADQHRKGWLRVTVPLTEKDPDLNRKVRELLPNALVVRAELPEPAEQPEIQLETGVPPVRHYAVYHLREHQQPAEVAVLDTFDELYEQVSEED